MKTEIRFNSLTDKYEFIDASGKWCGGYSRSAMKYIAPAKDLDDAMANPYTPPPVDSRVSIDLFVKPVIQLVGPPASGKTTLGRMIADLLSVPFSYWNLSNPKLRRHFTNTYRFIGIDYVPRLTTKQQDYLADFVKDGGKVLLASLTNVVTAHTVLDQYTRTVTMDRIKNFQCEHRHGGIHDKFKLHGLTFLFEIFPDAMRQLLQP